MNLQLAGGSGLADGSASFNAALARRWRPGTNHLEPRAFRRRRTPPHGRGGDGDLINQVFFDSTYYGTRFEPMTLAITTRWFDD